MILYHGTSSRYLNSILKNGLSPRNNNGKQKKGNWKDMPSNPNCVYLTSCYAGYFATCACSKNDNWLILEIDTDKLDQSKLMPDEDFIAQALKQEFPEYKNIDLDVLTMTVRDSIEKYKDYAEKSLSYMGTCAYYGSIPPSAIVRHVVFDNKKNKEVAFEFMDPTITIMNYRFCGDKYKSLTDVVMGNKTYDQHRSEQELQLPEIFRTKQP